MKTCAYWLGFCFLLFGYKAAAYDDNLLQNPINVGEHEIIYPVFALYHLPGVVLPLSASHNITLVGSEQVIHQLVAPETPGHYHYALRNSGTGEILQLHLFVLVPADQVNAAGRIEQYKIGHYPAEPLGGSPIYLPPAGYVRVTTAELDIPLSPNFTVRQFLSKQTGGFPKYLVMRPQLLVKLERILRALNQSGRPTDGLYVMSGFRTPYYNKSIGNVQYSRHMWGGAADIFVDDNPRDGQIDDLNGDGVSDRKDAQWLAAFVDAMSERGEFTNLGGVGIYGSTSSHGPFVHIDVRGYKARW